ncbi:MAG: hypothetical protein RR506_07165, partial [Akkermansia sp.]
AVASVVGNCIAVFIKIKGRAIAVTPPQPFDVRQAVRYATHEELRNEARRITALEDRFYIQQKDITEEIKEMRQYTSDKLGEILRAIGRLE